MKNKPTIKLIIFSSITLLLTLGYAIGFKFLNRKNQGIADERVMINNQIAKMEQSFDTKKQSQAVAKIGDTISQHFLKSSEIPLFLTGIELIGQKTGATIRIASVDEIANPETGTGLSLNISAVGDYVAIYRTLVELENLPYLSTINNLSLVTSQNPNEQIDMTKKSTVQKPVWSMGLNLVIKSYIK